jgi:hypothetical protein
MVVLMDARGRLTVQVALTAVVVVRPRRYTAGFAFLVAAGGTVAVVLYRYVDVGSFGPMAALALFVMFHLGRRAETPMLSRAGSAKVG